MVYRLISRLKLLLVPKLLQLPPSPTGAGSGSVTFTVNNSSVINSIGPSGHSANGTAFTATIYGTNLTGATGVVFNSCQLSVDGCVNN